MLTQQQALDLFEYKDGKLFWRVSVNPRAQKGMEAGSPSASGHFKVCYRYKWYWVHRIIFLMFNGVLPALIDHVNNDPSDNRIENLELWSKAQPAGQRIDDKVAYAIEILKQYAPERLA